MDEATDDTESVLAAYRERKRKALETKGALGEHQDPAPVASPAPPPPPSAPSHSAPAHGAVGPADAPTPAPSWPPPLPGSTPMGGPPKAAPTTADPGTGAHFTFAHPTPGTASAHPPSSLSPAPAASDTRSLQVQRPAALSSAPGATLSALGPALRLSDALLKDTRVSVKGSPGVRAVGVVLILLGLVGIVLDRRAIALDAPVPEYLLVGMGLLAVGCLLVLVGLNFPRNRRLAVRLAANQREEWKRVQGESVRLAWMARGGLAATVAGLLVIAGGYVVLSIPVLALGGTVTVAGLALLLVAQVRRGIARRLYVQTLVLSGLEASGLGGAAPDDRVQPVILALDRLLGALPESEVQAFLSTPQARAYLELVDEATRSQRGP